MADASHRDMRVVVYSNGYMSLDPAEAEKNRARRRRMIQMKRRTNAARRQAVVEGGEAAAAAAVVVVGSPVPVVGGMGVVGRMRYMEDGIGVRTTLCSPAINAFLPVHYFGVYDGHGGDHYATICKNKMHEILEEELMGRSLQPNQIYPTGPIYPAPGVITDESLLQETWRRLMSRCFAKTEMVAFHTCCRCGGAGFLCPCDRTEASFSGTTATAVVLTEKHIVAASCGDSRAVLFRGGRVVPLTFDHKPNRPDERVRIEATGRRVVYMDTARVEGILAMSRSIGDYYLKPSVISMPDITLTRRDQKDEFLILASDGVWDVMPVEMAGRVVRECLSESKDTIEATTNGYHELMKSFGIPESEWSRKVSPSRSASACALLSRLALARGSGDNVSVVVVDLTRVATGDYRSTEDNIVVEN